MLHNNASNDDNGYGISRSKHTVITHSDPNLASTVAAAADDTGFYSNRNSSFSTTRFSAEGSPMMMSPWNSNHHSPWLPSPAVPTGPHTALIGSLVREEGHIYSLATRAGDLLYTGSDSKNIRVWKNLKEFSGFKSASGLVKAIVISNDNNAKGRVRIFSGHQDGKIRVWKVSSKNPTVHRRSGSLPTLRDILKASIKPSNYIEVKRHKSVLWIKHSDAISCLSLDEERGLLYSASWDRSFKVWRIADSKCLESVTAHTDAVNSVVTGSQGLVFTGSADGTVKAWGREEIKGGATKHVLVKTLIKQETAVTALAMDPTREILYCGSSDGLVNFWEMDGAELVHGGVLKGHELAVLCVAAKGRLVLSGSADTNICVWRREEGAVHTWMTMLTGHAGPVKCLAVEEEEGKWKVYSGSLDKSVKVWSVSEHFDSASESFRSDRSD